MNITAVKFPRNKSKEFNKVLRERVRDYFRSNNISTHFNAQMVIKTIFMLSLWFVPYFLMVFGVVTNVWGILGMWVLMGLGMAGLGFSVMHDANHGAYSNNQSINKLIGYVLNILGGNAASWRIQHNVLHHSYTNIDDMDEDIAPGKILRLSPHQEQKKYHQYQHIYAWVLYSLMTLLWISAKEFKRLNKYRNEGLIKGQKMSTARFVFELVFSKVLYYIYVLIIPIMVVDIPWYLTVAFFFIMHLIGGFILAAVFQPAHVMVETAYPMPDEQGLMEDNFLVHQMLTTTNFAPNNKFLTWFVGGLNYQVEHHLFPNICHVHYPKIAKIVRKTAAEYNIPYYSQPTFYDALKNHGEMLKSLGKAS